MTVSWMAPGLIEQHRPALWLSLDATEPGEEVKARRVSFRDQMSGDVAHAYHVELTGLAPQTCYHYTVTDGGEQPSWRRGSFVTAPGDEARLPWRFSSYGDLATPTAAHNRSGQTWTESSDNAFWAVRAIAELSPQPVLHLLNGDLCYANLDPTHHPEIWGDFLTNIEQSADSVPWMPCLGNHEIEWGSREGPGEALFNGANGYGNVLCRFALPDNGVAGLRGNFWRLQVGTVLFVSLDAGDVAYQDGGSFYLPPSNSPVAPSSGQGTSEAPYRYPDLVGQSGASIPAGSSVYNRQYTGELVHGPEDSLLPGGDRPNQQTAWLEATLRLARAEPGGNALYPGKLPIDMIVVQMHHCALSSSWSGNGSDLGIRRAWLPLFDRYEVDLVLSGHEHNYERSHPVRGYLPGSHGEVKAPNPGQEPVGSPVSTRLPAVVHGAVGVEAQEGVPVVDTSAGTVFLVLGGGGTDGPTAVFDVDAAGRPQAKVLTERNAIRADAGGRWSKNPADSVEPAAWSARRDGATFSPGGERPTTLEASRETSWGYATFDVEPGDAPGVTSIVMTYHHAGVAGGVAGEYVGEAHYEVFETVRFTRSRRSTPISKDL